MGAAVRGHLSRSFVLPTPDGYPGVLQYSSSSRLPEAQEDLGLLANQVNLDYHGTLKQWTTFCGAARCCLMP